MNTRISAIGKKEFQIVFAVVILFVCSVLRGSSILLSIAITGLLLYVFISGYKNRELLCFFIFLFGDYCGGLLPLNLSIFGIRCVVADLAILLVAWLFFSMVIKNKGIFRISLPALGVAFGVVLLAIFSASNARNNFGQNFLRGVFTQRQLLAYFFLPFILKSAEKKELVDDIKSSCYKASVLLMFLYGIQYLFLYTCGLKFLTCEVSSRILIRLHLYPRTFLVFIFLLVNSIYSKTTKVRDYILFGILMIYCMVFGQYRMMSFGALIVAMIAFYMGSDRARRKLKIIYTFFIVSMIPIFKVVVTYLTEDMKGASASAGVRNNAMMYYSKILARSPWFGVGSINNTNGVSDALLGAKYGFYLIDLGAFALKFMYGNIMYYFYYLLLGVGVLVGYKYIKKYNNSVLFFFCVYSLVTSMTLLTGYYYSSCVILVLVIALYKGGLLDENRSGNT